MNTSKSIAILNTSAPYSSPNAKDALDIALILGSYEQDTTLFFVGDGVWQLIDNQQPELLDVKNFLKTFSAFEFYDLDKVYVCEQSLTDRGLATNFHIENVKVLPQDDFNEKIHQQDIIYKF